MESLIADEFHKTLTLEVLDHEEDDDDVVDDSCSSDFEFSFSGAGDRSSPVPADEIFHNGQIRPIFPFNSDEEATTSYGPPLRKLFVSSPERDDVAAEWSSPVPAPSPAPEMSRKSNSTGFSKLWRFRDLLVRSHSDGKDAFVFLTGKGDEKVEISPVKRREKKAPKAKAAKSEGETAAFREKEKKKKGKKEKSAYEVFYGGRREKEAGRKGKSYLPYKQDLVGFFTNVNGMSRNVHPY